MLSPSARNSLPVHICAQKTSGKFNVGNSGRSSDWVEGRPWIPRRSSLDPPGLGVFSGSPGTKRSSLDPRLFVVQSRPSLDPVSEKASSLDPRTKNGPLWLPNFKTVHQSLAARTDIQTPSYMAVLSARETAQQVRTAMARTATAPARLSAPFPCGRLRSRCGQR